jgi:hypothetical protein
MGSLKRHIGEHTNHELHQCMNGDRDHELHCMKAEGSSCTHCDRDHVLHCIETESDSGTNIDDDGDHELHCSAVYKIVLF